MSLSADAMLRPRKEPSHAADALCRVFEVGSSPARLGRSICKLFRDNVAMIQLQHKQDASDERFWRSAPENALLAAISSGVLTRADLHADASTVVAVDRRLASVVAALDDRGLLAPAGDVAALQALFDQAIADAWERIHGGSYRFEVEKVLLGRYPAINPGANGNLAIRVASRAGDESIVRLLLADARVNPAAGDNYAIRLASENGHTEVVRLLLADARVNPAAEENYAIQLASQCGHTDVVHLLVADARVDPAADDNYAIIFASQCGQTDVVRLLLADARVDPTAIGNDAIRAARKFGHTETEGLLCAAIDSAVQALCGA